MSPTPLPLSTLPPKLAGLVGGLGTIGLCGAAWLGLNGATDGVVRTSEARADAVGRDLAATVDVHLLDMLPSLLPEPGAVWSWDAHGSGLAALHEQISAAALRHGFSKVRTLHLGVEQSEIVLSHPQTRHPKALSLLVSDAATPTWGSAVDYRPEMSSAWLAGKPASRLATSKRAGSNLTTWVPVTAATGRTVAVLELTENVDKSLTSARSHVARCIGAAAALLALSSWLVGRATRQLVRSSLAGVPRTAAPMPLAEHRPRAPERRPARPSLNAELAAALIQLELGDLETPIETADPALSARFEAMRAKLAKAATAEARLKSAESSADAKASRRREAIAALGDAPQLVLDAGAGRRAETWLIDLHHGGLVVRVAPYSVVDLAPGMPVLVEWSTGDGKPFELTLARRCDTDQGVEYTFTPPPGTPLPGTPPELTQIAYARQTPRVSAEFLDVSAVLLAGSDGVLATQVVDISADGLRIQVAVPPAELALTGTRVTLVLQLAADQPEIEFGVLLRSIRPSELGCYVGLEFDPDTTRDYDTSRAAVAAWVAERLQILGEVSECTTAERAA